MDMLRPFTEHPASVGESYLAHMLTALCFGGRLLLAGGACLVHAFLPFLCVKTGSRAIAELNDRMIRHRRAPTSQAPAAHRHIPT